MNTKPLYSWPEGSLYLSPYLKKYILVLLFLCRSGNKCKLLFCLHIKWNCALSWLKMGLNVQKVQGITEVYRKQAVIKQWIHWWTINSIKQWIQTMNVLKFNLNGGFTNFLLVLILKYLVYILKISPMTTWCNLSPLKECIKILKNSSGKNEFESNSFNTTFFPCHIVEKALCILLCLLLCIW